MIFVMCGEPACSYSAAQKVVPSYFLLILLSCFEEATERIGGMFMEGERCGLFVVPVGQLVDDDC